MKKNLHLNMHRLNPIFSAKLIILGEKSRSLYFKVNVKLTEIRPTYDFRDFPNDRFFYFQNDSCENSIISPHL